MLRSIDAVKLLSRRADRQTLNPKIDSVSLRCACVSAEPRYSCQSQHPRERERQSVETVPASYISAFSRLNIVRIGGDGRLGS